jgi:hypothetical protein
MPSWRENRLPDNLPRLVASNLDRIPAQVCDTLLEAIQSQRTGLFDTHPSDRDRIARAMADSSEGIFVLDGPAMDLFRNFDGLARDATFDHYRALLGPGITQDQLYPVADALLDRAVAQEGQEAIDRYFLGALGAIQPIPLPAKAPAAPADLKAAKVALADARTAMLAAREASQAALERWSPMFEPIVQAEKARALLKAGNRIRASDYGLSRATPEAVEAARDRALAALRELDKEMLPFTEATARRMTLALALLEADLVASRVPDGPLRRDEARALYPCAAHLNRRIAPELVGLLSTFQACHGLIVLFQEGKNERNEPLIKAVLRAGGQFHERLTDLKWKLGDAIAYPFEHAQDDMSLGRYVLPQVPNSQDLRDLMGAGQEAYERIVSLHHRVLGRLATICEAVETKLGFSSLNVPETKAGSEPT